ncbi:MAG: metallophosphoesterase [bacterium]|nr:metallophosphoesterase [bacterium]
MARSPLVVALIASSSGCFSTSYDLTSQGAPRRELVSASPAPEGWTALSFDDSAWTLTGAPVETLTPDAAGAMPTIYVRQRFDVGAAPERYRQLKLTYVVDGQYVAYVNGHALTPGSGGVQTLSMTPGMMTASQNLLALEINPTQATVAMDARLNGDVAAATGTELVKGPYLLAPTIEGVKIQWETASPAASQAIVDGQAYDAGDGTWHSVTVGGLQSDHSYAYHVEAGDTRSDEARFATAPPPGRRLRFAVFGDNRSGGDVHRQLVEGLLMEAPDFVLNTGDMVGESTESEWQTFFDIEHSLLSSTPLFPVMGNHEHDYGEDDRFAQLFPLGSGSRFSGRVYSLDYGSVHIAALDSNGDLGAQAQWLEGDLADADARGRLSFVALHWGPVCGCSGFQHGSNDDADPIQTVAARHHVAVLFSGHNHLYERGVSQGLTYVVTGGGGAPLQATGTIDSTQATFAQNHYVIVDVLGNEVRLTAKTAQGMLLDDATVDPR